MKQSTNDDETEFEKNISEKLVFTTAIMMKQNLPNSNDETKFTKHQ